MTTIKTYLPESEVKAFEKFASKMKKNVPDFSYEIGEAHRRIFIHHGLNEHHQAFHWREWHTVCEINIQLPEDSGWRLLATLEDGVYIIVDQTKELILKNPEHGPEYTRCDVCKHRCHNSYIIFNESTGEELQVGCECVKKFGLPYMNFLAKFTSELHRSFNFCDYFKDEDGEEMYMWNSAKPDHSASRSILVPELICAAKAHYDVQPKWIAAFYDREDRVYHPSRSSEEIQAIIGTEKNVIDEEYAKKVCEYVLKNVEPVSYELSAEMVRIAKNFYTEPASAPAGFFMVKMYEDHLKAKALKLDTLQKGMQVKVTGEIITHEINNSYYYGDYHVYGIKTPKGYVVSRKGVIPVNIEREGNNTTSFYALIEYVDLKKAEISVGRALKHPKKGIEIIEL